MPVIARSLRCLLLACAALLAGCGADRTATAPPPSTRPAVPPTSRQLAQIHSSTRTSFFWLGRAYRGETLARATLTAADPPDSIFQYGKPTCRPRVGCTYGLGVATLRRRAPDTTQRCWKRLGAALVLGCDQASTLQVYTGPVEVFLSSRASRPARVARALRLKGAGTTAAASLSGLVMPTPFTCHEARLFPAGFRARLPAQLSARSCAG